MKKSILILLLLTAGAVNAQFGIKGGANFSNVDGEIGNMELDTKISYHIGAFYEISLNSSFSFQPEVIFSVQGADVDSNHSLDEIDLKYINIPMLLKVYLTPKFSIEAGPQFSYLISDNLKNMETEDFDFALAGGVSVYLTNTLFLLGRYVYGLSVFSKVAEVIYKNSHHSIVMNIYLFSVCKGYDLFDNLHISQNLPMSQTVCYQQFSIRKIFVYM